jgi:hypothetical protein
VKIQELKKVIVSQREEIEEKSKKEKIIQREVDFLKLKKISFSAKYPSDFRSEKVWKICSFVANSERFEKPSIHKF